MHNKQSGAKREIETSEKLRKKLDGQSGNLALSVYASIDK